MKRLLKRPFFQEFAREVDPVELDNPDLVTVLRIIWFSISSFLVEKPGQIIGSAFVLLMLWGAHGKIELLNFIWPDWRGPGVDLGNRPQLIAWIPWDHELISFLVGLLLLVGIPTLIIKFVFREPLSNYGLGLPPKGRRQLALLTFFFLTLISLGAFWIGSQNEAMRAVYPFYRPFTSVQQFILYEVSYLPFFIAIEFIFRGYLLFGLATIRDSDIRDSGGGVPGEFFFGRYALLIQMLSYTAWHLGKPLPELWGTLIWGLGAGATAYTSRSIWPVILSHWLLNVFLDYVVSF